MMAAPHLRLSALALFIGFVGLSSCVSTKTPTIAHVHIGHTLTAWAQTPGRRGLFVIAEQEAAIANQHARYAVEGASSLDLIKEHTGHVLHAIDPDLAVAGPGLGYGFRPAIGAAASHMRYAAESDDVSGNIKEFEPVFAAMGSTIEGRLEIIIGLANAILDTSSLAEAAALANEVLRLTEANENGADENGDGAVAGGESGLKQVRRQTELAIGRENPPYTTVDTYYLFNLIRLSSGGWAFKTAGRDDDVGGGGGGGGY